MLEKLFTGPNLIVMGMMVLCAVMMRNAAVKSGRSRGRDVEQELATELPAKERTAEGKIHRLEIRLHDYDRDVAARMQTTFAMLDQLISEADQEIVRLETLLEDRETKNAGSLSPEQRPMVAHLAGAGYSIGEIARLTNRTEEVIAQILGGEQSRSQRAA